MSQNEKKQRHRWAKLAIHEYVCAKCGMRRSNREEGPYWVSYFHYPTGTRRRENHIPPCEEGPLTAERLAQYDDAINAALGVKRPGWTPPF